MKLMALRASLRIRLLATTLAWIAIAIAVSGWGLGNLFRVHVEDQLRAELIRHLDQLTANVSLDTLGRPALALQLSDPRFNKPFSGLYWQVDLEPSTSGPKERGALRSRSLWDQALAVPDDIAPDGDIHQHRIKGPQDVALTATERTVHIDDATLRIVTAADEALMMEPVSRFSGALWLSLGVLGFGLAIAAFLQVIVGLAPLRALRLALTRVRNGDSRRLEGRFPSELAPLVDEFNTVLAQNAQVVERARTQAGNLAHALKTPLAVMANAVAGHDDARAELIRTQIGTARQQVDYHLTRAQAAAASRVPGIKTPIDGVIDGLLRTMRRLHAERSLTLAYTPSAAHLHFRGEEQDLQEMLGNLLDNACKWARTRVLINARLSDKRLFICVDDDGAGIPEDQRIAMLQRGARADEQVPGTGLGLAIVDDLAQLYGGQVKLAASPLGGLRACLDLPAP